MILKTFLFFRYLDYFQVMTYDLHSSKDGYTGINSPLYRGSNDFGISAYLNVVRPWTISNEMRKI